MSLTPTASPSPTPKASLYFALKFLLLEIGKQSQLIEQGVRDKEAALLEKSRQQLDYIFNAHTQLQTLCIDALQAQACPPSHTSSDAHQILTRPQIQSLQQIGFYLMQFAHQLHQLVKYLLPFLPPASQSPKHLPRKPLLEVFELYKMGLHLIEPAFINGNTQMATTLCRLKIRVQFFVKQLQKKLTKATLKSCQPKSLVPLYQLPATLEHAANQLLGIGEQLLSATLGQTIRFHQMQPLAKLLDELDDRHPNLQLHPLGTTKSGCQISGLIHTADQDTADAPMEAIIKQGRSDKLSQERAGVEAWHRKFPGIAPQLLSYQKKGSRAALLYEYLTGETLESLIQHRESTTLKHALKTLFPLLQEIWQETQIDERVPAHFMKQLKKRLPSVYLAHPNFKKRPIQIGNVQTASLKQRIRQAAQIEKQLTPAKAVYIHGDFNVDNIIFDPVDDKISFIDLHRSRYDDYVQDLSTFTVSCFRILNFAPKTRRLITSAMQQTYHFGQTFAQNQHDDTFEMRYALGLARHFITSTQFVLEEAHAKEMFYRGQFLLEQLCELTPAEWQHYQIPPDILRDSDS